MAKNDLPAPPYSGLWKIDIMDENGYRRIEAVYDRSKGQYLEGDKIINKDSIIAWQTIDGLDIFKQLTLENSYDGLEALASKAELLQRSGNDSEAKAIYSHLLEYGNIGESDQSIIASASLNLAMFSLNEGQIEKAYMVTGAGEEDLFLYLTTDMCMLEV